ncbi:hypothetical protein ACFLZH_05785 [Patescibacteria group bacterium]
MKKVIIGIVIFIFVALFTFNGCSQTTNSNQDLANNQEETLSPQTGRHLHFEIKEEESDLINPNKYY